MEKSFNFFDLIRVFIKWKKHLLIVLAASIVLSIIFSAPFIIKPKYKSTAIVYPYNLLQYSEESSTEQLLQIFESDDIKDSIIIRFNLAKHYDIDTTKESYYSYLIKKFESNVSISKTDYESIKIEIYDVNPKIAYDMVNSYIEFTNSKIRRMQREKLEEVLNIIDFELTKKKREMDSLDKLVYDLKNKFGFVDLGKQAEEVTKGLLGTVEGAGARINQKEVNTQYQSILAKSNEYAAAATYLWKAREEYLILKNQHENALKEVRKILTYTNVVSSPKIADKKSYPVRWLIVLVTSVFTLVLSAITIVIIENKQYFAEKFKLSENK